MTLSEIRSTLREIKVSPVKTLGQNFLHDRNLCRWIVDQAEIVPEDYVVEIGPGLGALTEFILAKGAQVLALEKDKRLADFLRTRFDGQRVEVVHIDALDFDVRTLFAQPRVKLIGNLPYNIASQLLIKFLEYPSCISLWLFMLQREMAERLTAIPGTKDYGALTLQLQFHYEIKRLKHISTTVFFPAPEVESSIVRVRPRDPQNVPACIYAAFVDLVRRGFSQRRKQLRNLLRETVKNWEESAGLLKLDPKARAESLSLDQWVALTNYAYPLAVSDDLAGSPECFPVVDAADTFLRQALRAEVHGNNLLHRAVHIFIFNKKGELFLQKRSRWKDRHPLVWDSSAAGHLNGTETYEEAAARELLEEIGIAVPLEKIDKLPASDNTGQEFICLFRGTHNGPLKLHPVEIDAGIFFPLPIVTGWITARPGDFAPGFLECWKAFRRKALSA